MPFNEEQLWNEHSAYVCKALELTRVNVLNIAAGPTVTDTDPLKKAKDVVPGEPVSHSWRQKQA